MQYRFSILQCILPENKDDNSFIINYNKLI